MKTKKILLSLILTIILISTLVLPASAIGAVFSISTDEVELKNGDTFEVVVAVNTIDVETGIILVEFYLDYDFDCLEIIEWHHNSPEKWGTSLEDMTTVDEQNGEQFFVCSYFYTDGELGKGVTEDNQLFTTITFRILSEDADNQEIKLYKTSFTYETGSLGNELEDCVCNDDSITLDVLQTETHSSETESTANSASETSLDHSNATSDVSEVSYVIQDFSDESLTATPFDFDSLWKIVIAVCAVLIVVAFSFWLNKFLKDKKTKETI